MPRRSKKYSVHYSYIQNGEQFSGAHIVNTNTASMEKVGAYAKARILEKIPQREITINSIQEVK